MNTEISFLLERFMIYDGRRRLSVLQLAKAIERMAQLEGRLDLADDV